MTIDTKNVTIKVRDGSATPKEIEIKLGEGNLTWSEKKPRQYIKDRGKLDTVRNGDEEPVDVTLDSTWEFITTNGVSGTPVPTLEDVLKQRGPAAGWVSTSSDLCEPYAVDIVLEHDPECSGQMREIAVLADFRYETADHDLNGGTIKFTGKCNVTEANVTRVAQTA